MKKRRLILRDSNLSLSETINNKEDKKATNNYLKDLTEIKNEAYAVVSSEEEAADRLLLTSIRQQAKKAKEPLCFA